MSDKIRLKPVLYSTDSKNKYENRRQNTTQQIFLLKALKITNDPKKLREMIGVRTIADVYRTLDKLAMRKEYHAALSRSGISFDFIVEGLKDEATGGDKSADRIKALQVLLKSLGLDKYDSDAGVSNSWEEELVKSIEKDKAKELEAPKEAVEVTGTDEYEVKTPDVPESMRKMREEEDKLFKGIYD